MKILLLTFATVALATAADPFSGTWTPNVDNWKLSPGAPERRKHEVITLESVGKDKYRAITRVDGKPTEAEPPIWNVDGKDHEVKNANGIPTSLKWQRIDDRHLRMIVKSSKGAAVVDYVVSTDSRTLTVTRKGSGATSGRTLDELLVYDRRSPEGN